MGWTAQVVERWNPYARVRHDLFGVIDIVVLDGQGGGPLGVQVTSGSHVAARLAKAKSEIRLRHWLAAPARFQVWGYRKVGPSGKRKLWELRVEQLGVEDIHGQQELEGSGDVPAGS